jgi:hypothetical protein
MISLEDARDKYSEQIKSVNNFEQDLLALGYSIEKQDAFELGAEWKLSINSQQVGSFLWNVPHMLALEINGEKVVDEDYLRSQNLWQDALDDALAALTSAAKK